MNDSPRNYYELLGVGRTASVDEIRTAYAAILKEIHAGIAAGKRDPALLPQARAIFSTLNDPEQREAYDRSLPPLALVLMPPIAGAKTPSANASANHRNFFARAWRVEVPAWKIFWFMGAPWLLFGLMPYWAIGAIYLLAVDTKVVPRLLAPAVGLSLLSYCSSRQRRCSGDVHLM